MKDSYARELSGGQKKLLELARVIIQKPKILLLDEPLAGVNPKLSEDILSLINTFVKEGISIGSNCFIRMGSIINKNIANNEKV